MQYIKRCFATATEAHYELMNFAHANGFSNVADEIAFFKTFKPQLESRVVYYSKLFAMETSKPAGTAQFQKAYYEREVEKIASFYNEHQFMVRYYRSGDTFLDDRLFVRTDEHIGLFTGTTAGSNELHALCGGFAAELLANELLADYLVTAIKQFVDSPLNGFSQGNATSLKWTESKAALIELLYALYSKGCFNQGRAQIKEIAALFERLFEVDLGNYYRGMQELRIRKTGPAVFLQQLIASLTKYTDETDLNYKG